MITKALLAFAIISLSISPVQSAEREPFTFAYVMRQDDQRYAEIKSYAGLIFRQHDRPIAGARAALKEIRVLGRRAGLNFELVEAPLTLDEPVGPAIERIAEETGSSVFVLDLDTDDIREAAEAAATTDRILFNVRESDTSLRQDICSTALFHTLPSQAMMSDALAQYLRHKNWRQVLMLVGADKQDQTVAQSFRASAEKFGLTITGERSFVLSNDPRNRADNNIQILTGELDYDVVFLSDSVGEFGRYVPFATYHPRPVVGSEGLIADAWNWTWERHGAPQLNQRFDKLADRLMEAEDWAAWAAIKAVVEAVVRTESTDAGVLKDFMLSDAFTLDTYKGAPGTFRPGSQQLRQPILLHTYNAVIARAPLDDFLHAKNNLDTLGIDPAESACR